MRHNRSSRELKLREWLRDTLYVLEESWRPSHRELAAKIRAALKTLDKQPAQHCGCGAKLPPNQVVCIPCSIRGQR